MKSGKQWIVYSAIRLGIFALVLVVLLLVGVNVYVAAIGAAIIGLCVSYIFFRPQRDAVAKSVVEARAVRTTKNTDRDNDFENDVLDRLEGERREQ